LQGGWHVYSRLFERWPESPAPSSAATAKDSAKHRGSRTQMQTELRGKFLAAACILIRSLQYCPESSIRNNPGSVGR